MTLQEFVEDSKKQLENFRWEWSVGNEKHPEHYPLDLSIDEWDEQFSLFHSHSRNPESDI